MSIRMQSFICTALLMLLSLPALAQPAVLQAGMTPNQSNWTFDTPLDKVSKEVKFYMRVQRQGNLSHYGTFDYYFRVIVTAPDGTEAWNDMYGFDEQGYADRTFTLPTLFWERSPDRANPLFGMWKVRLIFEEKESKRAVTERVFNLSFKDGRAGHP